MARGDDDTLGPNGKGGRDGGHGRCSTGGSEPRSASVVRDLFAEPLVRAVGVDFFTRMAEGELDFAEIGGRVETG
jgi:hypothetical protein